MLSCVVFAESFPVADRAISSQQPTGNNGRMCQCPFGPCWGFCLFSWGPGNYGRLRPQTLTSQMGAFVGVLEEEKKKEKEKE